MRRDILRVSLGRLALELALGVALLLAEGDEQRAVSVALAVLGALGIHATRQRWTTTRRAFFAAHLAMAAAAVVALLGLGASWLRIPVLSFALGAAIELAHLDLMLRRKIHETLDTVRWPRSVLLRRIGSVIIASAGARAMVSLEASAHLSSRLAVAVLLVALGATILLTAGFNVGPGRPHTRPLDAMVFLSLAAVCALCPIQ